MILLFLNVAFVFAAYFNNSFARLPVFSALFFTPVFSQSEIGLLILL
jgi:hypothetical protein